MTYHALPQQLYEFELTEKDIELIKAWDVLPHTTKRRLFMVDRELWSTVANLKTWEAQCDIRETTVPEVKVCK